MRDLIVPTELTTNGQSKVAASRAYVRSCDHWLPISRLLDPLFVVAVAIVTFITASRDVDFWLTDGASFALNGELVRDYLASGLGQNPMAFASEWFPHYLALTISLHLPIFPLAEAVVFASFGFSHSAAIFTHPVQRGGCYTEVARYVLDHSDEDGVVMFHGKDSKNLAFSVRTLRLTDKIFTLSAEKFLVSYNIMRESGIADHNLPVDDVDSIIDRYGISYLVFQPDFWTDQLSIAVLQQLTYSDRFALVAEFSVATGEQNQRRTIRVYHNNRPRPPIDGNVRINLPPLGEIISGHF